MKKTTLIIFSILVSTLCFAQNEEALVFFADKEDVEASLANPITILTQEALDRKYLHNIPIDERDVPLNETYKTTVSNQPGITVYAKSKWMNAVYVRGTKTNIENLLDLEFVTEVEFMNKDFNRPFKPRKPRDKFEIEKQPQPENYNYGAASNQTEMINVDILHDEGYTGAGITVAFMDNGYPNVLSNRAYQTMRNENRLLGYYDFVDRVNNPNGTGSHGANTLSTAAAYIEGEFVGTGPRSEEHTSELQSRPHLVCRLLLEKKKKK